MMKAVETGLHSSAADMRCTLGCFDLHTNFALNAWHRHRHMLPLLKVPTIIKCALCTGHRVALLSVIQSR